MYRLLKNACILNSIFIFFKENFNDLQSAIFFQTVNSQGLYSDYIIYCKYSDKGVKRH